jgi:hypothetical protein
LGEKYFFNTQPKVVGTCEISIYGRKYIFFCGYILKLRRMRWAWHVARMGEKRNAYRLLVGKPEGKRPLGRARRRWVDNIEMHLLEIGWGGVDWIGLAQDRDKWRVLVNALMKLRVP